MRRPDHVFTIYIGPVSYVRSCPAKLAEESRGFMGCHPYSCPDCVLTRDGWECWGENGHLQAHPRTREQLIHWLRVKAREQWKSSGHPNGTPKGTVWGYRFKRGSHIYYQGN